MSSICLEKLKDFINQIVEVPDYDWNLFSNFLAYKEFRKGELLLRAGEVENFMYFLSDGITRIFQFQNNLEYTLRFNFPISAFCSYASFITRTPSLINVEAITDIKVFRMSFENMEVLYEKSKTAERIGRRMIELLYVQRELKELNVNCRTAEDNYIELIQNKSELVEQIPQKYLASYLGITPESLSRIKGKLNRSLNE